MGVRGGDGREQAAWLADKVANLRVFEDAEGKMNRSVLDTGGEVLVGLAVHALRRRPQGAPT